MSLNQWQNRDDLLIVLKQTKTLEIVKEWSNKQQI